MEDLIRKIREFARKRNWERFHTPKNLVMALAVEVAEIAEHLQWLTGEESLDLPEQKKDAIREEVGDVFIYLLRLCDVLQIDLLDATSSKLKINARKYPVDKAFDNAKKYDEL